MLLQRTVLNNRWIPHRPTPKQAYFLTIPHREAMYGGAAGGGKSDALLMGALQYVHEKGYAALILRRSYTDLSLPGALMDRSHEWLDGTEAHWRADEKTWHFPSGATLTFGYMERDADKYRYQSAEFQYVAFDELTQFQEPTYRYLFSRLRRLEGANVPLRMRSASNPGGIGHDWVKQRFIVEGRQRRREFVRATLADNPYLDREEYVRSLSELDPITREQLLNGDWSARQTGNMFKREWFPIVDDVPAGCGWLRWWDLAATKPKPGTDPDATAGCLLGFKDGVFYLADMQWMKDTPASVEARIRQTAQLDGRSVAVRMEQEPGSSGKTTVDYYARHVLVGYDFRGVPSSGSKVERARPVSAAAESGNVRLVRGPWIGRFLDEVEAFPEGAHDDQVDALSGCFAELARRGQREKVRARVL